MPSDAHAHPHNLRNLLPEQEALRRRLGIACAASAWNLAEFAYHEQLALEARESGAAPMVLCFALHPQLTVQHSIFHTAQLMEGTLRILETLAEEGRLGAIGETGIDCYSPMFRETAPIQEDIFVTHLDLAIAKQLPVVLHIRRAMDAVFAQTQRLRKVPAVILHSYSGTLEDGRSLLKRGINCYFSFGNPILLNHKTAIAAFASLPQNTLLFETDAPFQPPRGERFSQWGDLSAILEGGALLRQEHPEDLQRQVDANFRAAFGIDS